MIPPSANAIHSLPPETLSDIFRLAVVVAPKPWPPLDAQAPSLKTELAHIANAPLLTLSRVCSRWHTIAINTPTFWSNVEINGVALRDSRRRCRQSVLDKTLRILRAGLDRSDNAPLSISLKCEGELLPTPIFQLLAQHSHRWETVHFGCSLEGIETLVLRGRLPRLKNISFLTAPQTIEFLEVVPCLKALDGIPPAMLHSKFVGELLRRENVQSLACRAHSRRDFQDIISLLPKLSVGTDLYLTIHAEPGHRQGFQPHWTIPLRLPSVTAPIFTLVCVALIPKYSTSALRQIFASLTLPNLRKIILACGFYPKVVFEWPHTEFLALCERSDLGRCLKNLQIAEVRITERELLEILVVLPALEHLEVGDVPSSEATNTDNSSESVLITDNFLRAMTCAPGQEDCPVPRLSYLACVSRLAFTHNSLADFITSRLARLSEADSQVMFHVCIHPLPGSDNSLISTLRTRLREIAIGHRQFVYQVGEQYKTQFERHS
ncbi:hypothetical protein DFH06DRAFT_1467120 [Mycena polygramma]|nr:hypothetical protein DFH06DRAFT_1467120 [Mycena polygramma]